MVSTMLVALASGGFDRFVLKPNDGFGNSNIGFFDSSSPVDEVAACSVDRWADLMESSWRVRVWGEWSGGW